MRTLHLVGHNQKWNLDAHFQNNIGEGFIFCAYSFDHSFADKEKISGYNMSNVRNILKFDLQYYGKKESASLEKGKLSSYPFHPCNITDDTLTNVYMLNAIIQGINYQIHNGYSDIIIPNYYENQNINFFIALIKEVNKWLVRNKDNNHRYFMTIPFTNHTIIDAEKIDKILFALTDKSIVFDGYYIVCESKPETRQKVSIDIKYLQNLSRVLSVIKKQNFITIYAYANWDALVFLSLTDIDYITIATFENLRTFNIKRFLSTEDGGPSKGWFYSEKLLNFVKAQFIDLVRDKNCLDLIKNERNIFSDIVLDPYFPWNNLKPEVHKNYLLAINKQLYELSSIIDIEERKAFFIKKIDQAIDTYEKLEDKRVYLLEESRNYHLAIWKSFLLSK